MEPNSTDHPEVKPIFRDEVAKQLKEPHITSGYYSKYEYTALLAMRAQQIAEGAKPLVSLDGLKTSDPMFVWNVAKREIEHPNIPPPSIAKSGPLGPHEDALALFSM